MAKLDKKQMKHINNKVANVMENFISRDAIGEAQNEIGYVDIIGIAKGLDFSVGNAKLSDEEDGFIFVNEAKKNYPNIPGNKLIGVNSKLSLPWKRFVIAHEIGHYFLHYIDNAAKYNGMYAHRENAKGKGHEEQEADYFAACLLMPKELFSEKYTELNKDGKLSNSELSVLLAKEFIVTPIMAGRRIEELELSYGK